jgi:cytochrome c oxidase assembly factor CtaG
MVMAAILDSVPVPAPAPTWGAVADTWRFDLVVALVAVALAGGYLAGLTRLRRQGVRWPVGRSVAFLGLGVPSLVVATMGWPAVYAPMLFSVYVTQLTVLLLVVPLLLAMGRPIGLAGAALGPRGSARLTAVLHSRAARIVTVPMVSPVLLAALPFLIFYTPLYEVSLYHPWLLPFMRVAWLACGLVVLVPLWEADTIGVRFPYAVALLFAFIELLADAVPGIVIRLDTHIIAGGYVAALARPWGPSPLYDQQIGGDVLWCLGEAIDLPFLALLVVQWLRSDARDAARIDSYLDEATTVPSPESESPREDEPALAVPRSAGSAPDADRPWWETDASVFGDRASRYQSPTTPPRSARS